MSPSAKKAFKWERGLFYSFVDILLIGLIFPAPAFDELFDEETLKRLF
jgi:hypothetical protein